MRYFVTGTDNQSYGPVDLDTLRQWASEGRLLPNTPLTDEAGAHTVPASVVLGAAAFPPAPQFIAGPPCRNCGRVSPRGTALCAHCGALLVAAPESEGNAWNGGVGGCLLSFLLLGAGLYLVDALGQKVRAVGSGGALTAFLTFVLYVGFSAGLYFLVRRRNRNTARGVGYGLGVGLALILGIGAICGSMKHP